MLCAQCHVQLYILCCILDALITGNRYDTHDDIPKLIEGECLAIRARLPHSTWPGLQWAYAQSARTCIIKGKVACFVAYYCYSSSSVKLGTLCMALGTRMHKLRDGYGKIAAVVVVVAFTYYRSSYPTTSAVHPVSVLILHPREMQILWSQTVETERNQAK